MIGWGRETSRFAVLLAIIGHSTLDFDVRTLKFCKNVAEGRGRGGGLEGERMGRGGG